MTSLQDSQRSRRLLAYMPAGIPQNSNECRDRLPYAMTRQDCHRVVPHSRTGIIQKPNHCRSDSGAPDAVQRQECLQPDGHSGIGQCHKERRPSPSVEANQRRRSDCSCEGIAVIEKRGNQFCENAVPVPESIDAPLDPAFTRGRMATKLIEEMPDGTSRAGRNRFALQLLVSDPLAPPFRRRSSAYPASSEPSRQVDREDLAARKLRGGWTHPPRKFSGAGDGI